MSVPTAGIPHTDSLTLLAQPGSRPKISLSAILSAPEDGLTNVEATSRAWDSTKQSEVDQAPDGAYSALATLDNQTNRSYTGPDIRGTGSYAQEVTPTPRQGASFIGSVQAPSQAAGSYTGPVVLATPRSDDSYTGSVNHSYTGSVALIPGAGSSYALPAAPTPRAVSSYIGSTAPTPRVVVSDHGSSASIGQVAGSYAATATPFRSYAPSATKTPRTTGSYQGDLGSASISTAVSHIQGIASLRSIRTTVYKADGTVYDLKEGEVYSADFPTSAAIAWVTPKTTPRASKASSVANVTQIADVQEDDIEEVTQTKRIDNLLPLSEIDRFYKRFLIDERLDKLDRGLGKIESIVGAIFERGLLKLGPFVQRGKPLLAKVPGVGRRTQFLTRIPSSNFRTERQRFISQPTLVPIDGVHSSVDEVSSFSLAQQNVVPKVLDL